MVFMNLTDFVILILCTISTVFTTMQIPTENICRKKKLVAYCLTIVPYIVLCSSIMYKFFI